MQCRGTKTFPVVLRHTLVSYFSVPRIYLRHNWPVYAPKGPISLIPLFFRHPVLNMSDLLRTGPGFFLNQIR